MDLALYIYNFLQEKGTKIIVPNFGIFSVEKIHAVIDKNTQQILPPKEIIHFERNESITDNVLANFIVSKTGENIIAIEKKINDRVNEWNQQLLSHRELFLEHLGSISISKEIEYSFTPLQDSYTDFGLEPITLQENSAKDKTLKQTILWGFLALAPVMTLLYLGYQNQDLILGKKSFENTKRIQETPKKDSIVIDSTMIKNDTLQVITENENLTIR